MNRFRRRLAAGICAAFALSTGSSCVAPSEYKGILVASDPPGARVLVDGKDSGWLTPVHLGVPREDQRVDILLDGYRPASVLVRSGGKLYYLILWKEAYVDYRTWRFPLWLNWVDGLWPIKLSRGVQPSRIYVPLRLATEG